MVARSIAISTLLAAMLSCAAAAGGQEQDAPVDPGQRPPSEAREDPKPKTANECVTDKSGFQDRGQRAVFAIELSNACTRRVACKINAYIVTARGPTSATATLTLAENGKAAAVRSHEIRVAMASGMANTSRGCRFL